MPHSEKLYGRIPTQPHGGPARCAAVEAVPAVVDPTASSGSSGIGSSGVGSSGVGSSGVGSSGIGSSGSGSRAAEPLTGGREELTAPLGR